MAEPTEADREHEHHWVEITTYGDGLNQRFVCVGCGEGRTEKRQ